MCWCLCWCLRVCASPKTPPEDNSQLQHRTYKHQRITHKQQHQAPFQWTRGQGWGILSCSFYFKAVKMAWCESSSKTDRKGLRIIFLVGKKRRCWGKYGLEDSSQGWPLRVPKCTGPCGGVPPGTWFVPLAMPIFPSLIL